MEERVTEEYSYDKNGNRLTAVVDGSQTVSTYDAQDKMLSYGDNIYSYSPTGSLLTKTNAEGTTTYSYDSMGNLLKVVLPDNRVITYKVDARGRRIGKSIDGVFQYGFVYGDQLNPIAKVDEEGNIIESYVYGLKSNIPEYVVKDNVKYKIISNHLGSPIEVRATTGGLPVLSCKYDSFGNILEQNGDFELPFRFAGGIWDGDTKLIRFGVRDYDPEVGRWTSVEPLGFAGSRNWYVYAGNDGVNYLDITGMNPILIERAISVLIWLLGSMAYDALTNFLEGNFQNSHYMKIMNRVSKVCPNPVKIDNYIKENIEHPIIDGWDYLQDSYSEFGEDLYDFFNESNTEGMNNYYRYKANQSLNRTEERLRKRLGL